MLSFADATGNLFTVLGRVGALIENLNSYQQTQKTAMIDTTSGVVAQLNDESDVQALMGSSYIGLLDSFGALGSTCQQIAAAVVNRKVFRDNPQFNQNLVSYNTVVSLKEVIRQMKVMGASVLAHTVTATPGNFYNFEDNTVNTYKGVIVASTKRPFDGRTLEHSFSESILFQVTADSYDGGATEGNEPLQVTGAGSQSNVFAFDWPLGSNCFAAVSAISGAADNSQGNLLTNSSFEDFTVANTPDQWEIVTGAAGTDVFEEETVTYDDPPSTALRILGDGSTLVQIRQGFDDSDDGTSGALTPVTQYSVCLFMRRDAVASAAGVLTVDLTDGDGTVIKDEAGTDNSFTVDLTALDTVYTPYTGTFRTPSNLADTVYLRIRLTTAYDSGRSFYLDRVSLGPMTQLYTGGPFVAVHSGKQAFEKGDYANCVISNSRGSAGTLNTWQTLMARLFPEMQANELLLPSSPTPTVQDSLIS